VPEAGQPVLQPRPAVAPRVVDPVDVAELLGLLVPDARVDEHQPIVVLHDEAPHAQPDAIPVIGCDPSLP
jgi:hypothetical protein